MQTLLINSNLAFSKSSGFEDKVDKFIGCSCCEMSGNLFLLKIQYLEHRLASNHLLTSHGPSRA